MADLRTPRYAHGPDELTTAEAAEWLGCDAQAIFHAWRRGHLKNRRKLEAPYDHRNAPWVWPLTDLKKAFKHHPNKPPRLHAEIMPHANVLQFIILTGVRSDMACGLLWDEVKESRGIIDFGKRHKMAERDPEAEYTIPITPELKTLLAKMREEQRRETLHVFVHNLKRIGRSRYYSQPVNPNTVNTYLKRALVRLDLVNGETAPKKIPSVHGFRNTFPEWACELNTHSREYVDAQLGHKQPGNNWMYFRNVKYLNHRRGIMEKWEEYCLSWQPPPADNIIPLTAKEKTWKRQSSK
jgi:integrase